MSASVVSEMEDVSNSPVPPETDGTIATRAHYAPPWADVSIIGIAGSSGSGKSTLSQAIVSKLNLPWVVILSIVSLTTRSGAKRKQALIGFYGVLGLVLQEPGCGVLKKGVSKRVRF